MRIVQKSVAKGSFREATNVWQFLQLNVQNVHKEDLAKCQQLENTTFQSITGWSAITFANWAENIQPFYLVLNILKAKCFVKLRCYKVSIQLPLSDVFYSQNINILCVSISIDC